MKTGIIQKTKRKRLKTLEGRRYHEYLKLERTWDGYSKDFNLENELFKSIRYLPPAKQEIPRVKKKKRETTSKALLI